MRHVFHKRVSWALLRLRETNETGAMELPRGVAGSNPVVRCRE